MRLKSANLDDGTSNKVQWIQSTESQSIAAILQFRSSFDRTMFYPPPFFHSYVP